MRYRIALIHNQDKGRLDHIRPAIQKLADRWAGEVIEIFEQPPVRPHSRLFTFWRALCFRRADDMWRDYRQLKPKRWHSRVVSHAKLINKLALRTVHKRNERRASAIEMIVSGKHIEAWRRFAAQGGDFLLVFEDDAVFKPQSIEGFDRVRAWLEGRRPGGDFYMDIAGGLTQEDLQLSAIPQERLDGFIQFSKPVTNTACGYILSAHTAASFCAILDNRPWFRLLGIDWLINMLMVERLRMGSTFTCLHAVPPIVEHGSLTGAYAAWER